MLTDYTNYSLYNIVSNPGEFKSILEDLNSKYNSSMWRMFTTVLPASRSKNFSAIVEATNIVVKASLIGPQGKKPLRSLEGAELYGDSIHRIGHGFKLSEEDLNKIENMNLVNDDIGYRIARDYFNKASKLIGGFHATWNCWIYEALAKQQITLKSEGADSGYVADLRTPAANKFVAKGTHEWFNSSGGYDIIADLKAMNKYADDYTDMPGNRVYVCSKALLDKIVADAGVISALKARMILVDSLNAVLNESYIRNAISTTFEIPTIVAIDERSRKEVDGVPQADSAAFDVNYISLIPVGALFNMHNSLPNYALDNNPNTIKTMFEGGLIGAIQLFHSEPYSVITNMESWTFPALKNPKWIVSLNSAAHSATGVPE